MSVLDDHYNANGDVSLEQVGSPTVGVLASRMLTVSTMLSAALMAVLMSVRDQVSQLVGGDREN